MSTFRGGLSLGLVESLDALRRRRKQCSRSRKATPDSQAGIFTLRTWHQLGRILMYPNMRGLNKSLLILSAALIVPMMSAFAQEAETSTEALQEVIVTGTRIAAPNEVSTSPIQVLSSQYIETSGKSDVSDLLAQLPQNFVNAQGQDLGNATSALSTPGGVATADLRGLGPNRTLVLVDGRRLGQGSPNTAIQSPAPELDQIPAGLVERVEVVTGGASAAYGSDAIAGVVNFILKKNFQGFQVDGEYGGYLHDNGDTGVQALVRDFDTVPATGTKFDGKKGNLDMLMGTNFDDNNGNVTAFFGYRHQNTVPGSARDYGGCQLNPTTNAAGTITGVACGGSSNSNFFNPLTGPNANSIYSVNGNQLVPRGSIATSPPADFNSQPYIDITREDDRYNAAFMGHDEITDYFVPYAEFYFMDDRTHTVVAPAALFRSVNPTDPFGSGAYATNCSNPLLSTQEAGILCSPAQLTYAAANPGQPCIVTAGVSPNCVNLDIGRRNIEGGGRLFDYEHENYRGVFGFKGDIAGSKSWDYDVYGQYYYTTDFNAANKFLNFQGIDNALQVTGTAASPKCITGASAGCVPYNIWSNGGVTQQQLAYLYLLGTAQGSSTLRTLHAEVTGKLGDYGIRSPVANDGLAVNIGFENRNDNERYQPDSAEESGLLSGFGGAAAAIDNTVSVSEEFLELRAPLVQNLTGVKELLFDGGYRRSDYSTSGPTNTYKFEVQYAPIEDYRLRVSYDKAIRAPSVIELFNPQIVETVALGNDPCAPTFNGNGTLAAPALFTAAQCAHLHVSAAQYGNGSTTDTIPQGASGQLSELAGGNPQLQPEQAETYTIGVNFAPSQIPNLTGSIDYWHIELGGEVGVIPSAVIE